MALSSSTILVIGAVFGAVVCRRDIVSVWEVSSKHAFLSIQKEEKARGKGGLRVAVISCNKEQQGSHMRVYRDTDKQEPESKPRKLPMMNELIAWAVD